ncbi:serine hydrolase [Motiliproteus coralliicola]|uniref:beta-lactamase n=1 Tax=Motiliproteus coralliicola TaxID=2283196 RepID=A0A369WDJ4_9GAMM|nr:serine hydrolase [Motiliproteus coralliicola]
MMYRLARLFVTLLALQTTAVIASPSSTSALLYDVSYVWSNNTAAVRTYYDKVARVLGPAVAKDLRIVVVDGLHGVIYLRNGDSSGAVRVARAHSRLLNKAGLDTAAPVISKDWVLAKADRHLTPSKQRQKPSKAPTLQPVLANPSAASSSTVAKPSASVQTTKTAHHVRDLEAAVEAYIKELRRKGRISADERTGWSVFDFTTGEKLVTINEEAQFQAASLIKPFIAAAFFHRVKQQDLFYGPKSRRHMERMIHHSDNPSTNWVMRQVGGPQAVQRILKQHYPGIFRTTSIVEYIPAGGKTYRNKASIRDYSRFLYALWEDNIVGAREIKRLMSLPGTDRIYTGARAVPVGTQVLNKTGSTARLCADMGILNVQGPDGKRYPYTLIGIIEKQENASNYTSWIRSRSKVIRDVSNIVYQGIAQRHDFDNLL